MKMIRSYRHSDFEEICSWWKGHGEVPPLPGMMIESGTFIAEQDGIALMTLTTLMTQSKEISYLEGFCSKPGLDFKLRRALGTALWDHCLHFLKSNGFKRVNILSGKKRLTERYKQFGMIEQVSELTSLGRVL
jgi:hypothetical protein